MSVLICMIQFYKTQFFHIFLSFLFALFASCLYLCVEFKIIKQYLKSNTYEFKNYWNFFFFGLLFGFSVNPSCTGCKNLHTDMNLHLKTYTTTDKGKTFDMYPRKGNKGYDVRQRFSEQARFNAVKNFYDLNPIKYYDARFQFYYNNGMLSRWRPW